MKTWKCWLWATAKGYLRNRKSGAQTRTHNVVREASESGKPGPGQAVKEGLALRELGNLCRRKHVSDISNPGLPLL